MTSIQKRVHINACVLSVLLSMMGCSERTVFLEVAPTMTQAPTPLDDHFIVLLKKKELLSQTHSKSVVGQRQIIEAAIEDLSLAIERPAIRRFTTSLAGSVFPLSEAEVRSLRDHPLVDFIERDGVYKKSQSASPTNQWNLDRLDQSEFPMGYKTVTGS